MSNWFEKHPTTSIILYTITIAGAVYAFSRVTLFDGLEIKYNSAVLEKDTTIQQYAARISFLETENSQLHEDINRYQEWLQNSPGTLQYIEHENEELKNQLQNKTDHSTSPSSTSNQKYSKSYELIKKSTAIIDEYTGIVVAVNDISVNYKATLSLTAPGKNTEIIRDATAGLTREYVVDGKTYQVTLIKIDYVSDTYSISIRQL